MENWYLIVGLGNPGVDYAQTRHNAGFLLVERLADRWRANWELERKFQSRVAKTERDGRRVLLVQPQTFMNLSGEAVSAVSGFYRCRRRRCWWWWTMRICPWANSGCGLVAAAAGITDSSPWSSTSPPASIRGCG